MQCGICTRLPRKSPTIVNITRTVCETWYNLAAKESGLECAYVNNDDFVVLTSGGGRHHWVSMCTVWLSQQNDWVEQWICIKFCIKLEHSSVETWIIQKATAMGNRWLAASSPKHTCSCITSCAEFLAKYQITQVAQPPYSPDFWFFTKLKSPLKVTRFQTFDEIQENMMGQLMVIRRTVWGPNMSTLKGIEASLSSAQCFLYLVAFQ